MLHDERCFRVQLPSLSTEETRGSARSNPSYATCIINSGGKGETDRRQGSVRRTRNVVDVSEMQGSSIKLEVVSYVVMCTFLPDFRLYTLYLSIPIAVRGGK